MRHDLEWITDEVVARLRAALPAAITAVDPTLAVPASDRIVPGVAALDGDLPVVEVVAADADITGLDVMHHAADVTGLVVVASHLAHEDPETLYRHAHRMNRAVMRALGPQGAVPDAVVGRMRASVRLSADRRVMDLAVTVALVAVEYQWTSEVV